MAKIRIASAGFVLAGMTMFTLAAGTPAQAPGGDKKTGFVEREYSGGGKVPKYKSVVFIPRDYNKDPKKTYPVIVFLHGAGESGTDPWLPTNVGIGPTIRDNEKSFPFIVAFPQDGEKVNYEKRVSVVLDDILKSYRADRTGVILSGVSAGGGDVWRLGAAMPSRWAGLVPICGWAANKPKEVASKVKGIPCWCFHGAKDDKVPLKDSQMMIKALKAAGGNPRFTVDPEGGHSYGYFNSVYRKRELWTWMQEQKRP